MEPEESADVMKTDENPSPEERVRLAMKEADEIFDRYGVVQVLQLVTPSAVSRVEDGGFVISAPVHDVRVIPRESA